MEFSIWCAEIKTRDASLTRLSISVFACVSAWESGLAKLAFLKNTYQPEQVNILAILYSNSFTNLVLHQHCRREGHHYSFSVSSSYRLLSVARERNDILGFHGSMSCRGRHLPLPPGSPSGWLNRFKVALILYVLNSCGPFWLTTRKTIFTRKSGDDSAKLWGRSSSGWSRGASSDTWRKRLREKSLLSWCRQQSIKVCWNALPFWLIECL